MRLAVGSKGLKKLISNLLCDARTGVFNLRHNLLLFFYYAYGHLATLGQGVSGIVNEVVKDAAKAFGIEQQPGLGDGGLQSDGYRVRRRVVGDCLFDLVYKTL